MIADKPENDGINPQIWMYTIVVVIDDQQVQYSWYLFLLLIFF
jgi:hypothetical protein